VSRSESARPVWPPSTGFFRLRLAKGAWAVPARICCEDGVWCAIIDGKEFPGHADPAHAEGVERIWTSAERIEAHDYRWLLAVKEHAQAHDPDHPCLHPRKPIRVGLLRPIQLPASAA